MQRSLLRSRGAGPRITRGRGPAVLMAPTACGARASQRLLPPGIQPFKLLQAGMGIVRVVLEDHATYRDDLVKANRALEKGGDRLFVGTIQDGASVPPIRATS